MKMPYRQYVEVPRVAYDLQQWAFNSGVCRDQRYMSFYFEVWADARWKGVTHLHNDYHNDYHFAEGNFISKRIVSAWSQERQERRTRNIWTTYWGEHTDDRLIPTATHSPQWNGDWTAKSYLGEAGFSRAFLLCHRYNI